MLNEFNSAAGLRATSLMAFRNQNPPYVRTSLNASTGKKKKEGIL